MSANKANRGRGFDMSPFTSAPLRLDMHIRFSGKAPDEVFAIMGDPQRIKDWYLLAKDVHLHEPDANGQVQFDVEFAFFGLVLEEILRTYMQSAQLPDAAPAAA